MRKFLLFTLASILCCFNLSAQFSRTQPIKVEVVDGNKVSFTIKAPGASSVQAIIGYDTYDLTKDAEGVWSATSKEQIPGIKVYTITIDGVSVVNPEGELSYTGTRVNNKIEIPDQGWDDFEIKDVNHGEVRQVKYYSPIAKEWREMYVYTPYGYDDDPSKVYPVIYLQHGGGEIPIAWFNQGKAANTLDNLIAEGKAVPCVVIACNGTLPMGVGGPGGYGWEVMKTFQSELFDTVIPLAEKTFRIAKDPAHRALCGLSMGGGQSFYVGLRNPETFGSVGVFSAGVFGGSMGSVNLAATDLDLEKEIPGIYSNTKKFNKDHKLFMVTCGEQDNRITFTRKYVDQMKSKGVNVEMYSYPGDHEWQVWRKSFWQFAQEVFK